MSARDQSDIAMIEAMAKRFAETEVRPFRRQGSGPNTVSLDFFCL